jgi:mono/diheme cytochrome c family protein
MNRLATVFFTFSLGCGLSPSGGRGGSKESSTIKVEVTGDLEKSNGTESVTSSACPSATGSSSTGTVTQSVFKSLAQPILQSSCVSCHNGSLFPNLTTDTDATTNQAAIVAAVVAGRMPPAGKLGSTDISALEQWASAPAVALALAATPPTYEGSIKAMINAKCSWCHSATATPANRVTPYMTTYALVKSSASKMLLHMNGVEQIMPPVGVTRQLAVTDTSDFQAWIQGGSLEGMAPAPIDPTLGVYYINTIKLVLDANCVGCHKTGATAPDLSIYQTSMTAAARSLVLNQANFSRRIGPG